MTIARRRRRRISRRSKITELDKVEPSAMS
jgi:hypothetical protein